MKRFLFLILLIFACNGQPPPDKPEEPISPAAEILTVIVVKPSLAEAITQTSKNGYQITLRLVCTRAVLDTVIDKRYTVGYNQGNSVVPLRERFIELMQDDIDAYQATHTVYNTAAFNNAITAIQAGLDGQP